MNKYEILVNDLSHDITVLEPQNLHQKTDWWGTFKIKNGHPFIFIEPNQPVADKYQILKEEFYHVLTAVNILLEQPDMNYSERLSIRKQELIARHLAYKDIVTIDDLFDCWKNDLTSEWEIAEYLGITPEFLHNAVKYLKTVYPVRFSIDTVAGKYLVEITDTIKFHCLNLV